MGLWHVGGARAQGQSVAAEMGRRSSGTSNLHDFGSDLIDVAVAQGGVEACRWRGVEPLTDRRRTSSPLGEPVSAICGPD